MGNKTGSILETDETDETTLSRGSSGTSNAQGRNRTTDTRIFSPQITRAKPKASLGFTSSEGQRVTTGCQNWARGRQSQAGCHRRSARLRRRARKIIVALDGQPAGMIGAPDANGQVESPLH